MKVIELLTKIANGEEVPKKIRLENGKCDGELYEYYEPHKNYYYSEHEYTLLERISNYNYSGLNDEVEILEEENELHANSVEFNINNDKRDCIITLEKNDLGINKLHLDNCYFYKENGKWYVKKYDFKNINIEEDKKIENIGTIYFNETPTEAILHRKIEEIIDYINKEK